MFVKFCACSFDRHVTKPCKRTEKSICIIIDPIHTDCPPKTTDVETLLTIGMVLSSDWGMVVILCAQVILLAKVIGLLSNKAVHLFWWFASFDANCALNAAISVSTEISEFKFKTVELQTYSRASIQVLLCLVVSRCHFLDHHRRNAVGNGSKLNKNDWFYASN